MVVEFVSQIQAKINAINAGASCYQLLEVEPNCSLSEIQNSYARLVSHYHPDKSRQLATENFELDDELDLINRTLTESLQSIIDNSRDASSNKTLSEESPPEPNRYLGQLLENRYQIESLLGEGGMGAVYRATDQRTERTVAVKLLHRSFSQEKEFSSRFIREARVAAQIDHANTVSVYDFGLLPDGAFIVMEFIEGISLRDLISGCAEIPLLHCIEIMRQTCSAIAAAHKLGIVHRDLKPENILLKNYQQAELQVKVIDLGLAKFIEEIDYSLGNITAQHEILGTPIYMSPEQCMTSKVDEQSDIYSLGILGYELLTGDAPFRGSYASVMRQHIFEPVPRLSKRRSWLPAALEELILQMLHKQKDERPTLARVLFQLDELFRELNPIGYYPMPSETKTLKRVDKVDLAELAKIAGIT